MTDNLLVAKVLLLASSWLNISLYTLELVLARRYFQRPNRPLPYQIAVGTLVFFDTVCTFTICVNACFVVLAIPLDGNPATLLAPTSIIIFMTHFSAAIEQTILCHLFFSLTGKMLISAGLALLILVQTGAAFASGGLILALNSEVTAALTASTVASVTCAAADIFIAICLSVKVWKMLSPADVITSSDSFVRKFFLLVVSSGLIVASNTLITMGLVLKRNPALIFFFTWQGRVYSLTLLANFLLGVHFRRDTDTDTSTETHGALGQRNPHSIATGLEFDRVDGYDTQSGHREESKESTASYHPSVATNYNVGIQMTRLDHRLPLHVKSEP